MKKRIVISLVLGVFCTIAMMIPFVSIPFIYAALPILRSVPGFDETGAHIEYVFLSVIPQSGLAWLMLISYFTGIWLIFLSLFQSASREPGGRS